MAYPKPDDSVVLVADDDALVRSVMAMALRSRGVTVWEAPDAPRAWDLAREQRLDLLILDLNMPGGSAHETVQIVRESQGGAHVPILVLSGMLSAPADLEPFGVEFASKPIELDDFLGRVDRLLDSGRTPSAP